MPEDNEKIIDTDNVDDEEIDPEIARMLEDVDAEMAARNNRIDESLQKMDEVLASGLEAADDAERELEPEILEAVKKIGDAYREGGESTVSE